MIDSTSKKNFIYQKKYIYYKGTFNEQLIDIGVNQRSLNKKEIQLNLCSIFSVFIFNELY